MLIYLKIYYYNILMIKITNPIEISNIQKKTTWSGRKLPSWSFGKLSCLAVALEPGGVKASDAVHAFFSSKEEGKQHADQQQ